ncbi:MAG TPA: uL15 family ribosomal protein [Candidatus Paceibacterota bacterium]|nr:uL15 family ribosomal protein [Candidatus Paceibacterota bacterium]
MKLHNVHKSTHEKRKHRIGRSGKRGSYSGRGVKGQKSRSGRRIRPAERDLIIRLPKRRGFANKEKRAKPSIFNLGELSLALKAHANAKSIVLDVEFLRKEKILPLHFKGEVKLLGDGEITMPLEVKGIKVSKSAKEKIEKAGGKIT